MPRLHPHLARAQAAQQVALGHGHKHHLRAGVAVHRERRRVSLGVHGNGVAERAEGDRCLGPAFLAPLEQPERPLPAGLAAQENDAVRTRVLHRFRENGVALARQRSHPPVFRRPLRQVVVAALRVVEQQAYARAVGPRRRHARL